MSGENEGEGVIIDTSRHCDKFEYSDLGRGMVRVTYSGRGNLNGQFFDMPAPKYNIKEKIGIANLGLSRVCNRGEYGGSVSDLFENACVKGLELEFMGAG